MPPLSRVRNMAGVIRKMTLLPAPVSRMMSSMAAATHNVVVVAFDGLQLLDLAGPVEVLRTATRLGAGPAYRTRIATPDGRPVRSESGVAVAADVSLAALARARERIDTLVVVGGDERVDPRPLDFRRCHGRR